MSEAPSPSASRPREAVIERVVPGGDGLARLDGVVTLVPRALPGDRLRVRLTRGGSRLLRGEILDVREPSVFRRPGEDLCPHARDGSCGGCDWPAARLEAHEELKKSLVRDALRRLGRFSPEEIPEPKWIGSPRNYRLRNRFHLDRQGRLGFYAPRSNAVCDLTTCEIVSKDLLGRLPAIRAALKSLPEVSGELSTLESRDGRTVIGELRVTSQGTLSFSSKGREKAFSALGAAFDGLRIVGPSGSVLFEEYPSSLDVVAGGATFRASVSSFFQGNRYLLDSFLDEVRSALRAVLRREEGEEEPGGNFSFVDLYAGVGFLTRALLETAGRSTREAKGGTTGDSSNVKNGRRNCGVVAVEVDLSSFSDLSENLRRWEGEGLGPARAVSSTAEAFLSSLCKKGSLSGRPPSLVIADPPRAGLSREVRGHLLRLSPPFILLVSCDPPTLARDLAELCSAYRLERLILLDLFPQTHHVETLVLLGGRGIR